LGGEQSSLDVKRILANREAVRRTPRAERSTGVLALRPSHLRSRQAFGAVGSGGGGRTTGARVSRVPARGGMDRRFGPVRGVRCDAPVGTTRRRGVPRVRSHGNRTRGRL